MSSTDDRIVRMQFDNKSFMKGAADTQKALADTNKAVDGAGKGKGLLDLTGQMQQVGVHASKMAIVTTTALATIANKVVNVGLNFAKSFTLDPLKQGFHEYEAMLTKQNVIQNATGKSATVVKAALNDLNTYSDKTIYSFGNMTDAMQKFVNAGIPLKQSVTTIKGIANAAAFAGASSEEANRAMYAFSQSMSLGFIQLQDWNQIENANMGTIQFKNTLLEAGVAAGTLTRKGKDFVTQSGKTISATKGWRDGLQEQWATTEVLNKALGKYADQNTKLGRKAQAAAQQVRTFSAFVDTLKESIGSGWSQVFTALFGNLEQATSMWTGLSNTVGGAVKQFFNFASTAIQTWRNMGGFQKVIQGIKNVLAPIGALLSAIGDAWSTAFPSSNTGAGKALYGLSAGFELITRPLAWLAKGIPAITPLLVFLFRTIGGGVSAVKDLVTWFVNLVTAAKDMADINAPSTGGLMGFIQGLISLSKSAVDGLDALINKGKSLGGALSSIKLPSINLPSMPKLGGGGDAAKEAASAANSSGAAMQAAGAKVQSMAVKIGAGFSYLWGKVKEFFSNLTATDVVKSFNQAIFATMAYEIINFIHTLRKGFGSFAGIIPQFLKSMDTISESLGDFAKAAKREAMAKVIIAIAIALGILALSIFVLSKIPVANLVTAIAALGALGYIMNKGLGAFGDMIEKMDGKGTFGKTIALSVAMMALATSMLILSTALLIMNKVDWGSLVKGLGSMIVTMKVVEKLGAVGKDAAKNMLAGAFAISVISGSLILLAGALLLFKLVDWESMLKAGSSLAGVALAVGLLAKMPAAALAKAGGAMLASSVGMLALANALILFALVEWGSIGKAAVMLGALAIGIALMTAGSGGGAGALIILSVAAAMVALAAACLIFNVVDWSSIGKAALVLGILVAVLAVAAAILTVFLYAIAPVAPVLIILAAGFALLGIGLLAFAAAMTIAMGLAAAGTAAFAAMATGAAVAVGVFFQVLAQQAPVMRESVLKILQEMITTVVQAVPMIIQGFKDLWAAIIKEMSSDDKKQSFGDRVTGWLNRLDQMARKYIPRLVRLAIDIFLAFMKGLSSRAGQLATVGVQFLVKLIAGIASKAGDLAKQAVDMAIKFAKAIEKQSIRLVTSGIALIAKFLHDLASAIRGGSGAIGGGLKDVADAMKDVGVNMIKGLIGGVGSMLNDALGAVGKVASGMVNKAKSIFKQKSPSKVFYDIGKFVVMGLANGVQNNAVAAITAVASMIQGAIAVSDDYLSKYFQKLDQQALAARGRAQGLAQAASKAQKVANTTKSKYDDAAANALTKRARAASAAAKKEEAQAKAARARAEATAKWEKSTAAERAVIRAQQAQAQLAGVKQAEKAAEAARVRAAALRSQMAHAGSAAAKASLARAARQATAEAKAQAAKANALLTAAKNNSADAIKWQKQAGEEASKSFQEQFDAQAKADADAKAFEKLSASEKAAKKREEAIELQKKADEDLQKAKTLAYTDLEAANALAQQALDEADKAREAADAAEQYLNDTSGGGSGQVIEIYQSDQAAEAFNKYADLYDSAYAAAAAGSTIEFNQYNTSPESLSDAEIYRQTNNQLTFASDKLAGAAA